MSLSTTTPPPPHSLPPPRGPSLFPPSPIATPHHLALLPHPGNRAPPAPARPALPDLPPGWTRTFHAAPAAYPRQLRESHGTLSRDSHPFGDTAPLPGETKAARSARIEEAVREVVAARVGAHEWTEAQAKAAHPQPPGLFLAVERWRRTAPTGGHTLVCTHPNGTQREHWYPTLLRLLACVDGGGPAPAAFGTGLPLPADADAPVLIDDIWLIDHHDHGSSVDLNAGLLGPAETWEDVGRDIANFIVHALPGAKAAGASASAPPYQLAWLPEGAAPPVRVLGFGGSYGGVGHVQSAAARPDVYAGLFLADSLISPVSLVAVDLTGSEVAARTRGALKRRDRWRSRRHAAETWLQLAFYRRWHPEVFALTLSHGLVRQDGGSGDPNVDDGAVELATPTWAEARVFTEPEAGARTWDKLPGLRVPVGFVVAHNFFPVPTLREMVWRPSLARNEWLPETDHLCLQADPVAVADAAWRFCQTLAAGWGTKEEIRESYEVVAGDKAKL